MAKKTTSSGNLTKTIILNGDPLKGMDIGNEKALVELLTQITAIAKTNAPIQFGQLKNSIMYKTKTEEGGFNDSGGDKATKQLSGNAKKDEGYVGSNLDYSVYQEFGTRNQFAQPFLRPAVLEVKGVALVEINKVIKKIIDKETNKGKGNARINKLLRKL